MPTPRVKKIKKNTDNGDQAKNRRISLAALIVSSCTLGFSMFTHFRLTSLQKQSQISFLTLGVGSDFERKVRFENTPNGIVVRVKFDCLLTNQGQVPTSILHWSVWERSNVKVSENAEGSDHHYAGMNPILLEPSEQKAEFPLTLSAKESKKLLLEVGLLVPKVAWDSVSKEITFGQELDYIQAERIFSSHGFAGFGQFSPFDQSSNGRLKYVSYGNGSNTQHFEIEFIKEDRNRVSAKFELQSDEIYAQGETKPS
jgi:hypothetical protein